MASARVMFVLKSLRLLNDGAEPNVFQHCSKPIELSFHCSLSEMRDGTKPRKRDLMQVQCGAPTATHLDADFATTESDLRDSGASITIEDHCLMKVEVYHEAYSNLYGGTVHSPIGTGSQRIILEDLTPQPSSSTVLLLTGRGGSPKGEVVYSIYKLE